MAKLYIVATPIGNLEDFTLRAIRVLKEVDLILAEDTRKTRILLTKYKIDTPVASLHQHSNEKKYRDIISLLESGKEIAIVSEAGTPGINDPGTKLVDQAYAIEGIEVIPIPGPNAAIAALSVSGFKGDAFLHLGFLPKKKGRKKFFENLKSIIENYGYTIIFYESPHRIVKTLSDCLIFLEDREVVVCRELTKKFETIYRGKISEVLSLIKPKGEFVVVINGKNDSEKSKD